MIGIIVAAAVGLAASLFITKEERRLRMRAVWSIVAACLAGIAIYYAVVYLPNAGTALIIAAACTAGCIAIYALVGNGNRGVEIQLGTIDDIEMQPQDLLEGSNRRPMDTKPMQVDVTREDNSVIAVQQDNSTMEEETDKQANTCRVPEKEPVIEAVDVENVMPSAETMDPEAESMQARYDMARVAWLKSTKTGEHQTEQYIMKKTGETDMLVKRKQSNISYEASWEKAGQVQQEGKSLIAAKLYEYCIECGGDAIQKKNAEQKALECYLQAGQYADAKGCVKRLLSGRYIITEEERRKVEMIRGMLDRRSGA